MAHSKQAWKRSRQSEAKRVANKNTRTRMKGAIKKVLAAGSADQAKSLADAMKRIDKAAQTHAIHANAAARYKSRVARALNKAKAAAK
jgi:small subunit ribosomal protein S20